MKGRWMLATALGTTLALVGCGANSPAGPHIQGNNPVFSSTKVSQGDALLGVWQMQGSDSRVPPQIAFKANGVVEVAEQVGYADPVRVAGTYQVNEGQITLVANPQGEGDNRDAGMVPQILERFTTYSYAIDGNNLTLTAPYQATRWVKL